MIASASLRPTLRLRLLASVGGNAAFAVGSWSVLAFLAKTADADAVGRYVLALALTAPVFLFANLGLREALATGALELPFSGALRVRAVAVSLAFALCGLLSLFYDGPTRGAVGLTALAKALDGIVDVVYGLWLREERQDRVAASMALRGVTTVLLVGGALVLTGSLAVACGVSALQSALGLGHALSGDGSPWSRDARPLSSSLSARAQGGTVGEGVRAGAGGPQEYGATPTLPSPRGEAMIREGALGAATRKWRKGSLPLGRGRGGVDGLPLGHLVPFGLAVALDSLAVNVPRYLIQSQMGFAKVGAFGAVCTFMQLGTATVVVGLTQVGLPRLSRLHAAGDRAGYARLLLRLLAAGLGLGVVGLVLSLAFGREALTLAFGPSYAAYAGTLRITMLAAVAWYASGILACGVTATRDFRAGLPIFAAGTAVVALAGLVLVPRFGLDGAAAAVGLGFLVRAGASGWKVVRSLSL